MGKDNIPDDYAVIDDNDTSSHQPFLEPEEYHLGDIITLESFFERIQRLSHSGVHPTSISINVNKQKRDLDTLILNKGFITVDSLIKNLNDSHRARSDKLCTDFCSSSDRRQHIRGDTPYIVFFTPTEIPEIRSQKQGIVAGSVDHCNTPQRLIFPCDPHYASKGISPDRIPTQTFAVLATPSITLDKNDNVVSVNWHVKSPDHIDLNNVSGKIMPILFPNQKPSPPIPTQSSQP